MEIQATISPGPGGTRILMTEDGDDCLKALLRTTPSHPRALHTLLEGVAMWYGAPVCAALLAGGQWGTSYVESLFGGDVWPQELSNVRFEFRYPRKRRRIRGPGDFRQLYLLHGGDR